MSITTNYNVRGTNKLTNPFSVIRNINESIKIIKSSENSKYITVGSNSTIYVSSDYGKTFSSKLSTTSTSNVYFIAITSSTTGQYLTAVVKNWFIWYSNNYGESWTRSTLSTTGIPLAIENWLAITSSTTGQYLTAIANNSNNIWYSNDYGESWLKTSIPINDGTCILLASSSDGRNLAVVNSSKYIYTSTDYGLRWSRNYQTPLINNNLDNTGLTAYDETFKTLIISSSSNIVTSLYSYGIWYNDSLSSADTILYNTKLIVSSINGQYLAAVVDGSGIYTSSTAGMSWSQSDAINADWKSITSSSSGQYLAAVVDGGGIYTSSNYGVNWSQSDAIDANWNAITSSDTNLRYLVALVYGGGIYTSSNYGVNWINSDPGFVSITSSSSGQYLAAVVYGGRIYTSNDYGASWTQTNASNAKWNAITSSISGQYLAAVVYGGGIYTSSN